MPNQITSEDGRGLDPFQLAVFHVLAKRLRLIEHGLKGSDYWPTFEDIAAEALMSRRQVVAVCRLFREAGILEVTGRAPTKANTYRLDAKRACGALLGRGLKGHPVPSSRASGALLDESKGHTVLSPPYEMKKDLKKKTTLGDFPAELQTPEFVAAWSDWRTHRAEKCRPVTPKEGEAALARLAEMGHERAVKALRHSTGNGYTGIVEPATNGHKPTSPPPETEQQRKGREQQRREQQEQEARIEAEAAGPQVLNEFRRKSGKKGGAA